MREVAVAIIAKALNLGIIPKDIPGTVVTEKYASTSNSFILPEFHKKFTKKEF